VNEGNGVNWAEWMKCTVRQMRAVLIWNSGLAKRKKERKRIADGGGGRGWFLYLLGVFALRWAGTGLCRCYGTACFHLWSLGYRYGVGKGERGGEPVSVLLTWRGVNRRMIGKRVS